MIYIFLRSVVTTWQLTQAVLKLAEALFVESRLHRVLEELVKELDPQPLKRVSF